MIDIVIAEDEYYFRKYLEKVLTEYSPAVRIVASVENGADAQQVLEKAHVDLLITDIRMPDRSGLELAQYLSENGRKIPVLILSGYAEFHYAQKAMRYGVEDYLLKPLDTAQLEQALEKVIQKYQLSVETKETEVPYSNPEELAQSMKNYIEEHYQQEISLDDLAANKYFMNPSYLSRLFKKAVGSNFKRYLITFRLEKAKSLMEQGMGVAEAALKVGFNNFSYFSKTFKEYYDMLPNEIKHK